MNEARTVDQFFSELRGSMDLVVETCALLVAKHPEKGVLLGQLNGLAQPIQDSNSKEEKHYKIGVLRSLASIVDRVAHLEAQIQSEDIEPTDRH